MINKKLDIPVNSIKHSLSSRTWSFGACHHCGGRTASNLCLSRILSLEAFRFLASTKALRLLNACVLVCMCQGVMRWVAAGRVAFLNYFSVPIWFAGLPPCDASQLGETGLQAQLTLKYGLRYAYMYNICTCNNTCWPYKNWLCSTFATAQTTDQCMCGRGDHHPVQNTPTNIYVWIYEKRLLSHMQLRRHDDPVNPVQSLHSNIRYFVLRWLQWLNWWCLMTFEVISED